MKNVGKIGYNEFIRNFEAKDMTKQEKEDAELLFMANSPQNNEKLNYLTAA